MKKLHECEIQRTNITPKQFFTYCKNQLKKKGINIENWCEFENWENPIAPCNDTCKHEDWEEPQKEICKLQPYDWQLFLQNAYNFDMEFDFWDDKKGFGYLYVGGIKKGSIVEIYAPESAGKTTLALQLCKQYQKEGKPVLYIDSERTLTKEAIESRGITDDNFYLMHVNNLEMALEVCKVSAQAFSAIVIDSLAGLIPKAVIEGDILDNALEKGIVTKWGAWYSYNENRIGQGRGNVKQYLKEHPAELEEITKKLREVCFAD